MRWRRRAAAVEPEAIDAILAANVALAAGLGADERAALDERTAELLDLVRWEAVGGLELTDEVRVTIAANAALPVLALGTGVYRQVRSVIVRPTVVRSTGWRAGPAAGTVADDPMLTSGVALSETGPLAISWDVALAESREPRYGRNVVIHEFAHKIDMSDGYADGVPPLPRASIETWTRMMRDERGRDEGDGHEPVLRDYAWENDAEFFAVATEAFFCLPARLAHGRPELYDALRAFYRQDPARRG